MEDSKLRHIVLKKPTEVRNYICTQRGRGNNYIPERDRISHGEYLRKQLEKAWKDTDNQRSVIHAVRHGTYIEFKSDPGAELIIKSLEDLKSKRIRLLNVRTETNQTVDETGETKETATTYATVFVADDKRNHFLKKIEEYIKKDTKAGKPTNAKLINSIAEIRRALAIESFWQDDKSLIPKDAPEWCEVWLSNDSQEALDRFEKLLTQLQLQAKSGVIRFPERAVKLVLASRLDLEQLSAQSDDIAEYRSAKTTACFWTELQNKEQVNWVKDLLERTSFEKASNISICILDTGVTNGHPLIKPVLADEDCQAVNPQWGTHDHHKHGTLMAGLTTFGDLMQCLIKNQVIHVRHHLESVKILPPPPNCNVLELWGDITSQGISRAEIQKPQNKRIFCMAVTANDTRDRGRPTSWSGQLDQAISGAEDNKRRLVIVSSGNCIPENRGHYPDAQLTDSIHDPAQAWNALTVGAYTRLNKILDPMMTDYEPVAPEDGLSPFSTTSLCWENNTWPCKPDIVLEGGNLARTTSGFVTECDDLSLLSTYYKPHENQFFPFSMTSAAAAQAAWMAANIQAEYPEFWPETVRALMVHSAEWTDQMKSQFGGDGKKTDMKRLLRICGYGVPNLDKALYSASNSLTLIAQSELQPFDKKRDEEGKLKSDYRTKDMHLYELPWPKEVLLSLPDDTHVSMRITLSYFIEPGPGEIGWKDRYRYASHALRFDLNSPGESRDEFIRRINEEAKNEDEESTKTKSPAKHWTIGEGRNLGSIHSDIWTGTAPELAKSNIIAVSPHVGWWRERHHLRKWDRKTRYTLVVSISTPEEYVDLYTPVAVQVGIIIPIAIKI